MAALDLKEGDRLLYRFSHESSRQYMYVVSGNVGEIGEDGRVDIHVRWPSGTKASPYRFDVERLVIIKDDDDLALAILGGHG